MATKVMSCKCQHEAQDAIHGKGFRVHNSTVKKATQDSIVWRCTVCGSERVARQ